jgi:hypothetical protein
MPCNEALFISNSVFSFKKMRGWRAWFRGFWGKLLLFFLVFAWLERGELLAKHGQNTSLAERFPVSSQPAVMPAA